jgi:DNA-binding response OmpR family regulator
MAARKEKLTVLLAEDDADLARMYRIRLEREGYEVLQASDGATALELARRHRPDLILLDIGLPHKDGIAVLEERLDSPELRRIPVVLLTAYSESDYKEVGIDLDALAFVVKTGPTPTELVRSIPGWLTRAKSSQDDSRPAVR